MRSLVCAARNHGAIVPDLEGGQSNGGSAHQPLGMKVRPMKPPVFQEHSRRSAQGRTR
ncbi:MAG TPA: hypothetical protein VGP64_03150 [Polyangia bacterium]